MPERLTISVEKVDWDFERVVGVAIDAGHELIGVQRAFEESTDPKEDGTNVALRLRFAYHKGIDAKIYDAQHRLHFIFQFPQENFFETVEGLPNVVRSKSATIQINPNFLGQINDPVKYLNGLERILSVSEEMADYFKLDFDRTAAILKFPVTHYGVIKSYELEGLDIAS